MPQINPYIKTPTKYFTDDILNTIHDKTRCTIDVPELNLYENHYVFVYGTLKRGGSNHDIIKIRAKNQWCGVGVTETESYDMLLAGIKDKFPIVVDTGTKARRAKVKGELWLVSTETILQMDKLESNRSVYDRVKENIYVGNHKIKAFMYVGVPKFWRDKDTLNNPMIIENKKNFHCFNQSMANKVTR